MLSSLSWNIFFTTIALLAGGYYAISTLFFYRSEISFWFKSKSSPASQTQAVVKPSATRSSADSIIGSVSLQAGRSDLRSSSVTAEEFVISEEEHEISDARDQIPSAPVKDELLVGTIADLLEEIKTVCQLIADTDGDVAQAESLLRTLLTRYPDIADGSFRDAITLYICKELNERIAQSVSISDAASWWEEKSLAKK